ncbi:hypothetical protein PVBG_05607 [Plasmodium vivax Brazil I]|uniref:PIR Superfamily Protein n=1 Tax=Plasmodium vivax (strain Brazil I) TaxID=1033975 RepID=A0A0J9SKC6_PLAV1|nr:hypothetical protein PVBG_05607 [Plasmodium vivax Brazil I]
MIYMIILIILKLNLYYLYTPLGSWIHPKLTGGKKIMNNLHQETEKIQYTSEYQENPYRISYQPSRYS